CSAVGQRIAPRRAAGVAPIVREVDQGPRRPDCCTVALWLLNLSLQPRHWPPPQARMPQRAPARSSELSRGREGISGAPCCAATPAPRPLPRPAAANRDPASPPGPSAGTTGTRRGVPPVARVPDRPFAVRRRAIPRRFGLARLRAP